MAHARREALAAPALLKVHRVTQVSAVHKALPGHTPTGAESQLKNILSFGVHWFFLSSSPSVYPKINMNQHSAPSTLSPTM